MSGWFWLHIWGVSSIQCDPSAWRGCCLHDVGTFTKSGWQMTRAARPRPGLAQGPHACAPCPPVQPACPWSRALAEGFMGPRLASCASCAMCGPLGWGLSTCGLPTASDRGWDHVHVTALGLVSSPVRWGPTTSCCLERCFVFNCRIQWLLAYLRSCTIKPPCFPENKISSDNQL